jgi:flagellar motor component MotA
MVTIIGWVVFFAVFIGMMSLMGSPSSVETGISFVIATVVTFSVVNSFRSKNNSKGYR